ncbi:MAG: hypothetical protein DRQ46_00340 [Gammaproteobacteria bacterium]|nr:MAG: hypothetical protein DRQ46_00340 [Gammaproteobacteria bacterium]
MSFKTKTIVAAASAAAIGEKNTSRVTIVANLANGASIFVGDSASQDIKLEAGASIDIFAMEADIYFKGTAPDTIATVAYW